MQSTLLSKLAHLGERYSIYRLYMQSLPARMCVVCVCCGGGKVGGWEGARVSVLRPECIHSERLEALPLH